MRLLFFPIMVRMFRWYLATEFALITTYLYLILALAPSPQVNLLAAFCGGLATLTALSGVKNLWIGIFKEQSSRMSLVKLVLTIVGYSTQLLLFCIGPEHAMINVSKLLSVYPRLKALLKMSFAAMQVRREALSTIVALISPVPTLIKDHSQLLKPLADKVVASYDVILLRVYPYIEQYTYLASALIRSADDEILITWFIMWAGMFLASLLIWKFLMPHKSLAQLISLPIAIAIYRVFNNADFINVLYQLELISATPTDLTFKLKRIDRICDCFSKNIDNLIIWSTAITLTFAYIISGRPTRAHKGDHRPTKLFLRHEKFQMERSSSDIESAEQLDLHYEPERLEGDNLEVQRIMQRDPNYKIKCLNTEQCMHAQWSSTDTGSGHRFVGDLTPQNEYSSTIDDPPETDQLSTIGRGGHARKAV